MRLVLAPVSPSTYAKPKHRVDVQQLVEVGAEGMAVLERWVWLELEGGYVAAARTTTLDGRPVIAEIRLFPAASREHDRFRKAWTGEITEVPSGGVTTEVIRSVRLRSMRELEHGAARALGLAETIDYVPLPEIPRRPGRAGVPLQQDARVAHAYVHELAAGSRGVISRTAERLSTHGTTLTPAYVRKSIARCRSKGLLTQTRQGRGGGELTDAARAILQNIST